ncbi:MAG: N-acetylmuramoyl-L-alanine amidase [Caulobacteraceae bacterium]|nr:N-acetylmuramoyl-L-alanine amidase [Caulobacteraceae bacterium]
MRVDGIPYDQGVWDRGPINPHAIVLHRTYGAWAGDYSVGKFGRGPNDPDKSGFHFLIGKEPGQVVQFYDTGSRANHCAGANFWAIGIEFTGTNDEPLTDWQVQQGDLIVHAINRVHGIPLDFYDGPDRVSDWHGVLSHRWVATEPQYQHHDLVTRSDYERMTAPTPPPLPAPAEGDPLIIEQPGRHHPDHAELTGYAYLDVANQQILLFNAASLAWDDLGELFGVKFRVYRFDGNSGRPNLAPHRIQGWKEWKSRWGRSKGVIVTATNGAVFRLPWS